MNDGVNTAATVEGEREACIKGWLKSVRRAPRRIVDSISQRARLPVADMPGVLPEELAALKVTDSISTRENRATNKYVDWMGFALLIWCLGVGFFVTIGLVIKGVRAALDWFVS